MKITGILLKIYDIFFFNSLSLLAYLFVFPNSPVIPLSCSAFSLAHLFPLHNIWRKSKKISSKEHEQVRDFLNRTILCLHRCCLGLQDVPIDLERRSISPWKGIQGPCFHNTVYYSLFCFGKKKKRI